MGMFSQGHIHHLLNIEILEEKIKGVNYSSPQGTHPDCTCCQDSDPMVRSRNLRICCSSMEILLLRFFRRSLSSSETFCRERISVLILIAARGLLNSWHIVTTNSCTASVFFREMSLSCSASATSLFRRARSRTLTMVRGRILSVAASFMRYSSIPYFIASIAIRKSLLDVKRIIWTETFSSEIFLVTSKPFAPGRK